jgi:hypothetical protein
MTSQKSVNPDLSATTSINKSNCGYATDQSQTLQRSSRASSLVIAPIMVPLSSNSRIRMTRPATQKQPALSEPDSSSDSDLIAEIGSGSESPSDQTDSEAASKKKSKSKKKKPRWQATSSKKKKPALASLKKQKN